VILFFLFLVVTYMLTYHISAMTVPRVFCC
jgi:hypothetical protein